MKTITVFIQKPVFDSFVYIRDTYIFAARKQKAFLKISTQTPDGVITCIVSPDLWLKDAKKIEKVFLIPNKPMVMYGNLIAKFVKQYEFRNGVAYEKTT